MTNEDITPIVLTARSAARTIGVTTRTLARWRVAGIGPAWIRVENRIVYPANHLAEYLAANMHLGAAA